MQFERPGHTPAYVPIWCRSPDRRHWFRSGWGLGCGNPGHFWVINVVFMRNRPRRQIVMILAYAGFAGLCFLIQGVFYLQRGIPAPFFWVSKEQKRLSTYHRILQGLICLAIAAGLLSILAVAILNRAGGIGSGNLEMAFILGALGVLFLARPDLGLRAVGREESLVSTQSAYRQAGVRVIGGLLLFGGLMFLTLT